MNKSILVVFALLAATSAQAAVFKCKGPDGKTVYSDAPCEYMAKQVNIVKSDFGDAANAPKGDPNARALKMLQDESAKNERVVAPPKDPVILAECKFSSYTYGDSKGKTLADNAKAECKRNNELKTAGRGGEISLEHYNYWKDHSQAMGARRDATVQSINAQRAINTQSTKSPPNYRCKNGLMSGTLDCSPN